MNWRLVRLHPFVTCGDISPYRGNLFAMLAYYTLLSPAVTFPPYRGNLFAMLAYYTLLSPTVTFPLTGETYSQCYRKKSTSKMLSLFIASDISTTNRFSQRKACDNLGLCLRERCLQSRQKGCSISLSWGRGGIA